MLIVQACHKDIESKLDLCTTAKGVACSTNKETFSGRGVVQEEEFHLRIYNNINHPRHARSTITAHVQEDHNYNRCL